VEEKEKLEFQERLNRTWGLIKELELVKDRIIAFWEKAERPRRRFGFWTRSRALDPVARDLMISDVKELYYSLLAAYEMLANFAEKGTSLDSCRYLLNRSQSLFGQCASELTSGPAAELRASLQDVVDRCFKAFSEELKRFVPIKEPPANIPAVIKVSDREYHLPCRVCGQIAVVLKIDVYKWTREPALIFSGITFSTSLGLASAETIFPLLDQNRVADVHEFTRTHNLLEYGLDAFCPECDRVYCGDHYRVEEEWDEGFYDCAYATCPQGHRRLIND